MLKRGSLFAVLSQTIVSAAIAQSGSKFAAPAAVTAPQAIGTGAGMAQIFGSLALVIATILVIGWIARRLRSSPRGRAGRLKLVDEIAIGPKERAVILDVDGMELVLGVGEGRVSILHRAPAVMRRELAPESTAEGQVSPESSAKASAFMDVLKRSLGR